MTVLQYVTLIYLEKKKEKFSIETLAGLFDVDQQIVLNDITALLYHPSFNKNRSVTGGLISCNVEPGKDPTSENIVGINMEFAPNSLKLNCLPVSMKKGKGEEEDKQRDQQIIINSQNFVLDAAITRIMKGRISQVTTHLELINETARQIELFVAQPGQIKTRIEALIEKEILKRADGAYDKYQYIS